jgi:hypothetical protein
MPRTIPVQLPNGRFWPKKTDAATYFREMLRRHSVGERVHNPTDHSDLSALLTLYDRTVTPGQPTKAGSGIAYFEKGLDLAHPGHTQCFFVCRTDGTRIDFSLGRALDAATRKI